MKPDFETAAIKAIELLDKYEIGTAPIDPLPLLKKTSGVLVMSFAEMSEKTNIERKDILGAFGCQNQDAVTTLYINGEMAHYVVTYNSMLSSRIIEKALARELGHIILGHNGTKPEEIRNEEAKCFAHHLLCPRPLIHLVQAIGIRLTTELLANITGFGDLCVSCMRRQPSVNVPAELNRRVRDRFKNYVINLLDFQRYASLKDGSALADLGSYMDGYVE